MKVNIKKYQQGGGMPFVAYQPFDYNPTAASSTASKSSTSAKSDKESDGNTELLSKEVVNSIIKEGMPGEVESFLKALRQAESGSFGGGFDTSQIYSLAAKGNQILHNADLMKTATTKAYENGGLEELAVSTTGGLYVRGESGKLDNVSLTEFNENRDRYQALTVNDLSQARRYDPRLSFDKSIISTIQNAVGIDKVSDRIIDIITKLGVETNESNQYVSKSAVKFEHDQLKDSYGNKTLTEAQKAGLQEFSAIYNKMGSEGMYNLINTSSTQKNHIKEAASFILSTLPPNAVNLLKARAVVNGNLATPENLVLAAFNTFTNNSSMNNVNYESGMNKDASGTTRTDASGKQINLGILETLIEGNINQNEITINNPEDASFALTLKGSTTGQLVGLDNKPINPNVLRKVLHTKDGTGISALVDRTKMYFGNKLINDEALDQIIYDGGEIGKVYVPVDADGNPNFEMLRQYTEAEKEIIRRGFKTSHEKNQVYSDFNLDIRLDVDGKPTNSSNVKEFLMLSGSTTVATSVGRNNGLSYEPSSQYQSVEKDRLQRIFGSEENKDSGLSYPDGNYFPFIESNVVKAPILLALTSSAHDDVFSLSGHGGTVSQPTMDNRMVGQRQQGNTMSSQLLK